MSPWAWLAIAGAAEVAWTQSIRPTEGFTRLVPTLVCVALAFAAVYPLSRAMAELPVGVAYAIFTACGAGGAIVLGVLLGGDRLAPTAVAGLVLIVAGVALVRA